MREEPLSTLVTGMTRQRDKGGASQQSLYDLLNGYIDASGAPVSRDGTAVDYILPAGTKGLVAMGGLFHVFALTAIATGNAKYVTDVLVHPDPAFTGTLKTIHFAKPFLGYLYVVAEFSDGVISHYWQQSAANWKASNAYGINDSVQSNPPNGYLYKPSSADNPAAWAAGVQTVVGTVIQPTIYNGYKYTAIEVDGTGPATGATEPVWIASDGAQVIEDVNTVPAPTTPTVPVSDGSPAGSKYNNIAGGYKGSRL